VGHTNQESTGPAASPAMAAYFRRLEDEADRALAVARAARAQGFDPVPTVEIPIAHDLAERVENLVGPPGIAARIRDLSRTMDREEVSLAIAKEVIADGSWSSPDAAIEQAVRTGLAILTEGVLVARRSRPTRWEPSTTFPSRPRLICEFTH